MKKLRIGEFRELGFSIFVKLHHELESAEQEIFLWALLGELIEPRGLAYGGGVVEGFVSKNGRGSAIEDDREAASAWLSAKPEVETFTVGALQDCWHDGPQYVIQAAF